MNVLQWPDHLHVAGEIVVLTQDGFEIFRYCNACPTGSVHSQ
jgi:thiazole synthase ThiGH ThiG subunit